MHGFNGFDLVVVLSFGFISYLITMSLLRLMRGEKRRALLADKYGDLETKFNESEMYGDNLNNLRGK